MPDVETCPNCIPPKSETMLRGTTSPTVEAVLSAMHNIGGRSGDKMVENAVKTWLNSKRRFRGLLDERFSSPIEE